ncbi:MAG: peptide chain release factor N(5)-glutamine methyltransferase [Bauldia sp.]|nr:peptide chain release factor N(5)-glutamine methyltransferase [Bauldia sp.]
MPDTIVTVAALRRQIANQLRAGWGDDSAQRPDLDAKLLVAHALGANAANLTLRDDEPVAAPLVEAALALARRRFRGEPVARIVGEREFWGLPFRLSPGTLVPRPDSETVVEAAVAEFRRRGTENPVIIDLGTGSGCILLAVLSELPGAFGIGTDRSEDAVRTARDNAARFGLGGRAAFLVADWAAGISGSFDAILTNPPYVDGEDLPELPVEVIHHDPRLALDGGADGLDHYRRIVPELGRLLKPGGFAVFEFGYRQAAMFSDLARAHGWSPVLLRDLPGHDRAAVLTR